MQPEKQDSALREPPAKTQEELDAERLDADE